MLTYSNQLKPLVLPEYGRNIQNMVDYCLTIEDRDRRTESAYAVVDAMLTLFPAKGDHEEHLRKLWDHVWIMSDYRLDVDYPYEHVNPEVFADRPDAVEPVRPGSMPYRHYGRLIPRLIDTAAAMEEGEERDALVFMIANQMKKTLLASANDNAEDARVFSDLRNLSHGAINLDTATVRLNEFKHAPTPSGKKEEEKMIAADALLAAATFAKPHGVKGEISVAVAPDDMDFVEDATFVFVGLDGLMVPFAVQAVRPKGAETLLLTLKGIDSDTKAARLTGKTLWLEHATLAGDDDGDDADSEGFYLDDLIGFTVIAGGAPVGEITDYDDSTDNVLFILRRPDGSEALIPASDDFIDSVDTQERTIAMTLPEGLLAL